MFRSAFKFILLLVGQKHQKLGRPFFAKIFEALFSFNYSFSEKKKNENVINKNGLVPLLHFNNA